MKTFLISLVAVILTGPAFAGDKSDTQLELLSYSWSHEDDSNYAFVVGQVKNISDKSIDQIEAVASFSDAKGNFVTSDSALIQFKPLLPDQVSPFKIPVSWNPAFKTVKVEFKQLMGKKLGHREKKK